MRISEITINNPGMIFITLIVKYQNLFLKFFKKTFISLIFSLFSFNLI